MAWGLLAAARLAHDRRQLSGVALDLLTAAVTRAGPVPPVADLDPDRIRRHMGHDKKRDAEGIAWVLPTDDGVSLGQRVTADEALAVLHDLGTAGLGET